MISKTPEQMMLYNARLKFQRDEAARMRMAEEGGREAGFQEGRQEGRQQGFREGEAVGQAKGRVEGRIILLQEMLGLTPATSEELAQRELSELNAIEEQLQRQLRSRS